MTRRRRTRRSEPRPLAAEDGVPERRLQRERLVDLTAAVDALVPGRKRLGDRRGRPQDVDHDSDPELAASAGVKATWTRIPLLRYLRGRRGDQAVLLQASRPGDPRLLLRVRAAHLHRLHGLRAGRNPLSGSRGEGAGRGAHDEGRAAGGLRGDGRARDEGIDRRQRPCVPRQSGAGLEHQPGLRIAVREVGLVRASLSRTASGTASSPRPSCTPASSTSASTCSSSGTSAHPSSRRSGEAVFSRSTSCPASQDRQEPSSSLRTR